MKRYFFTDTSKKVFFCANRKKRGWIWKNGVSRKKIVRKYAMELLELVVGCFVMAFGVSFFLLPNQLSTGGFSGIATIFYYLFHFPVGLVMLLLNIPLILISYIRLGKRIVIRSIVGTVLLSAFIDILDPMGAITQDGFLACIYGGICVGIGTALVLKSNASTGGTDLLSYIIRSYKPYYTSSSLIVVIDTVIIFVNVLVFKEIEVGLYSAIAIFLMGKMIDIIFEGINFTKAMFIISPKYKEIAHKVGLEVKRGSTAIEAKGMYKEEERKILFCVGNRNDIARIRQIANRMDKNAFIVVFNARETFGKGFK